MPENPRPDLIEMAILARPRAQIGWNGKAFKVMRGDSDLKNFTAIAVEQLLRDHVCNSGGKCKPRRETDQDWLDKCPNDPWWYFVVVPVPEFPKGLFVKMKLLWEDGDQDHEAYVEIVSVHEEK